MEKGKIPGKIDELRPESWSASVGWAQKPRVRRWPSPWKLRHRAAGHGSSERMANSKICRNPTVKRFLGICVDVDAEL